MALDDPDQLKRDNAALRAELHQKRAIFESSVDFAIVATDRDGRITDWNSGAERCFGWSAKEICGQTAERFFTPEDNAHDRVGMEMRLSMEDGRASDERWHLRKNGSRFWASGEMMPLRDDQGEHLGFIKVLRDRTEEHNARVALREAEANLQRAQEVGGVGIFTVDDSQVLHGSPTFLRLYGLSGDGVVPVREVERLIITEDAHLVSNHIGRAAGELVADAIYRIRRADDGELRWIARHGELKRDADGNVVGFIGTARDVTDERGTRELLERSERQARAFTEEREFVIKLTADQRVQADPDSVMRLSAEALGKRISANRVCFYRLAGPGEVRYRPGWTDGTMPALTGTHPTDQFGARVERQRRSGETLVFSDSRADAIGGLEPFAGQGVLSGICISIFDKGQWRGGLSIHHAAVRAWSASEAALAREVAELTWLAVERAEAVIRMEGRIGQQDETIGRVAGELRDQAQGRMVAEGQVRQLQKMEAVGQLTGGIAHDFNNMLAIIIGGLNLIQRRLARGETDVTKYADAAMDGATRAAALTQRLLAFSRQQPLAPEAIDANAMVRGLTDLLDRTLGERVRLETVLGAGVWKTRADPSQLENVIVNLAVNARDAMPEGGELTIETSNAHIDGDYASHEGVEPGQYVQIAVTDTGSGMPPAVLAKAFDPFFTTKGVGKGTGLGLSQVFGFVRQSGGHVKLYSEEGHGTTVKIYLPRFYGDEPAIGTARRRVAEPKGGVPTEIIMVVEDEDRLRNFTVEALRELGYTVVHASDGHEALERIGAGQGATLLFTDIVMPGMTGRQLADVAVERIAGLKVLYTTGYTRNAIVHNGTLDPGTNFLAKPYSINDLAAKVREVLDAG